MPEHCPHAARDLRPVLRQVDGSWICDCRCGGRSVARLHRDGRVERPENAAERDAHVHQVVG